MPYLIGTLDGDPTSQIAILQFEQCPGPAEYQLECYYRASSRDWQNSGLQSILVSGVWPRSSQFTLSRTMSVDGLPFTRSDDFTVDKNKSYALNQTIAQWDSAPWFLQLQLQEDDRSDTVFRLCWHYRVPNAIRLSCAKVDRVTGYVKGAHVVDDSLGLGAKTWRTQ